MSFKSNKSKLDFKVHYNFVYVCVYRHAFLCCFFFFFTIGSGCSSKKVDYFSYNFNSSSALRLLHISTMLKNNRETHRYHAPYDQDSQEQWSSCLSIFRVGLPPSAPTPRFQVAVMISAKHSEQWKMCMTLNYCSMSIQTEDEPEIKFVWSQSALIYRQYARH